MPYIATPPFGLLQTTKFVQEVQSIVCNSPLLPMNMQSFFNFDEYLEMQTLFVSQSAWFARSIDCQNLLNKTRPCKWGKLILCWLLQHATQPT